jgi:hypothetical protein
MFEHRQRESRHYVQPGQSCNRSVGILPAIFRPATTPKICKRSSAPSRNETAFLIATPKQLKISVTQRKQSARVISNRYKTGWVVQGKFANAGCALSHSFVASGPNWIKLCRRNIPRLAA